MCIFWGAFAHLRSALVGPLELLHQNSLEVASVAELETVESGPATQTWARSGGMQRFERKKKGIADVLSGGGPETTCFMFCSSWRVWRPKNTGNSITFGGRGRQTIGVVVPNARPPSTSNNVASRTPT